MSRWIIRSLVLVAVCATPAFGQTSGTLASELASTLQAQQLEAIAARDTAEEDRYVAALAFPGQLLVVSARYEAPVLLDAKIANRDFREVYVDLNTASIAGSKVLVTDLGADGLGAQGNVDLFDDGSQVLRVDGGGGAETASADAVYTHMLETLIAQLR